VDQQVTQTFRRARWWVAIAPLVVVLAGCSSSGGGGSGSNQATSARASLKTADASVQAAMQTYLTDVADCAKQSSPVVCLETADKTLGNKIHSYANLLAVGHGFPVPATNLTTTRDAAQTLANSLEILGDAQPTQANYNQVLNTFNVNSAITQLQGDVTALGHAIGQAT
jgi:hypothetical protein